MIINQNNKDTVLKGSVQRGFNQDPNEIRNKMKGIEMPKLNPNDMKKASLNQNKINLNNPFNKMNRFK